ncbi:hypothetical protein BD626DRAFT_208048 [Schizophyllum amplum]|uniref:BTB domain-containing protein n=1 Tax=Schizophyllum amplum TaxID=97359 RepID=A0A550BYK3_9AGAR|nr:hypothetical protein BD626DRAFT_208048 [Auriculariopsis ampla]
MDASASEPASCPVAGCRLPVDIFLQSSDGILTGAHTRNLETFGEAFPSSSLAAPPSEPIVLDEPADVLQLLMHFMHLIPQPSLEGRSFELVLRFAEAVDKYGVHAADQLCWLKMRDHAETNSLEVLQYAARLNLYDLLDIAAPHTLRYTFSEIARSISDHDLLVRWRSLGHRPAMLPRPAAAGHAVLFGICMQSYRL